MAEETDPREEDLPQATNMVRLRGRVGADPTRRTMPSGAAIISFRLVVEREATVMTRGSRQRSDWVDCTAWSSPARRRAGPWRSGDMVEVEGSLRRRHYRVGDSSGSRVEIEMLGGRRLKRAAVPKRAAAPRPTTGETAPAKRARVR